MEKKELSQSHLVVGGHRVYNSSHNVKDTHQIVSDCKRTNNNSPHIISNKTTNAKITTDLEDIPLALRCCYCQKSFSKRLLTIMHIMKHHQNPLKCLYCKLKTKSLYKYVTHEKYHLKKQNLTLHKCNMCRETFKKEKDLNIHLFSHHNATLKCQTCAKVFTNYASFDKHNHSQTETYICEVCGKSMKSKLWLGQHIERHFQDFKFSCKICGKGFYGHSIYLEHMNIHLEKKPELCDVCGVSFNSRQSLRAHRLRFHPELFPNMHKCPRCPKLFVSIKSCNKHIESGICIAVFVCDICGKRIAYGHSLVEHRRIHTGEKPFECDSCNKKFSSRKYLMSHLKIHTGAKPYTCQTCGKSMAARASYSSHLKHCSGSGTKPIPTLYQQPINYTTQN